MQTFSKVVDSYNKKLFMKALFKTSVPKQWRYIEDTDERYIISNIKIA